MNFSIARGVLASIHYSEMKKTHGWQTLLYYSSLHINFGSELHIEHAVVAVFF
jgi:hypothetical protein